ncbi:MAG: PilZ domain-containing protein [Candidatus Gastranaerophilales bacterium]|nr:PilZ domain-containing protein [Candidatus Gastranaerophilales bacterium]
MSEIRENQLTKLVFKTADNSEKELCCNIKDIYKDRISLNYPKETMYYLDYLEEGDEVNAQIFTPLGVRMFDSIILDSPREEEFIIEFIDNYIEIQRRKYLRVDLNTKIIIEREEKNIVTHTLDIGGGGVRFFYNGSFGHHEKVGCFLYLPMLLNSIKAKGIILKDNHLKKDEHVLFFTKIDEGERDKIIKKCFELERKK